MRQVDGYSNDDAAFCAYSVTRAKENGKKKERESEREGVCTTHLVRESERDKKRGAPTTCGVCK